jgi:hypothetical protein
LRKNKQIARVPSSSPLMDNDLHHSEYFQDHLLPETALQDDQKTPDRGDEDVEMASGSELDSSSESEVSDGK